MKKGKSIFMKRLCLVLSILMLIGFCFPVAASAATSQDAKIVAVADATGVTATLYNPTSAAISANLFLAAYRPDGALRSIQALQIAAGADATSAKTFAFDVSLNPDDQIKIYAWDQATLIPLGVEFVSRKYITIDDSKAVYDGKNVTAGAGVTGFSYVTVDQLLKRGKAFTATKSGSSWTHAKAANVELTMAFSPFKKVGSTLPILQVSDALLFSGSTVKRVLITVQ